MADASLALQRSIYALLMADPQLASMISGIFDHVPGGAKLPYIVIGEATAADWSAKGINGQRHTVTLHIWEKSRGRSEARTIMARLYDILNDADLALENGVLVLFRFDFSETLLDVDGETHHGIMRFRALTHA